MTVPAPLKAAWKSAQLMIAFHKDKQKEKRPEPLMWRPKDATARLPDDPEDREAILQLQGDGDARDVQIKMRPEHIALSRDDDAAIGWSGIVADPYEVRVRVGAAWIRIKADGAIRRETDGQAGAIEIEADGTMFSLQDECEIMVTGDGSRLTRRTRDQLDAITSDGVVSRRY